MLIHLYNLGDRRGAYRVSVGMLEGKRPFGTPCVDNIKVDLQEVK
jgi:hypothetical protein